MNVKASMRIGSAFLAIAAVVGVGVFSPTTALGAGPELAVESKHVPSAASAPQAARPGIPLVGRAKYVLSVSNVGDTATTAPVTVAFALPPSMRAVNVLNEKGGAWACSTQPDAHQVDCSGPSGPGNTPLAVPVGGQACMVALDGPCRIVIIVGLEPAAEVGDVLAPTVEVCGGGAAGCDSVADPVEVVPHFEITHFDGGAFEGNANPVTSIKNFDPIISQSGEPETQAAAHPESASTTFGLTQTAAADGYTYASGDQNRVVAELPPGFLADVGGVPACSESDLAPAPPLDRVVPACPINSQIGFVRAFQGGELGAGGAVVAGESSWQPAAVRIFNMDPPDGAAAMFGFNFGGAIYHILGRLKSDSAVAGGYRGMLELASSPQTVPLVGSSVTVWGVPASPSHDSQRGLNCVPETGFGCGSPSTAPEEPFLTLPTSCEGPVETKLYVNTWQGDEASASFLSHDNTTPVPQSIGIEGCNNLEFEPTLEARPTTNVADSPSGLDVKLHLTQNVDPEGFATAHLRDTVVTLPNGMTINPSAANSLDACSPSEIKLGTDEPESCPDAAKVGTVEVDTPLLDHSVPGAVYIASPYDNPFDSLLALYISLEDPISGTVVKIAGKVDADPVTGQLTARFEENPQAPFEDFRLHFFGGAGGSLRTPVTCGTYSTTTSMTPWSAPDSGPPATPSDTWKIEQAPGGGVCPTSEEALSQQVFFDGGTLAPIAGAHSPMVINLRREDGSQQFSALDINPPPGLVGKLAGIPYCPDAALQEAAAKTGRAEEQSPSCPAASYVGSVTAGAGAGPKPYYAQGRAYLTGPYKGGPLSLTIVTPATAGPFDLGTIVVRTALYVNPRTAQISAVSDPLPTILEGIPLDVRSVQVRLDRPDFTLNPTSCNAMSFLGALQTTLGQTTALLSRFQVGECGRLGLKPRMRLWLKGGTRRTANPALTAVLEPRAGDANLASVSVALPRSEFLDQSHIRTVCTRVQFAASQCPPAAIYGTATVTTPLLDYPLTGPVYLRSSDNPLPDLVPDLRGPVFQPIRLEAAGRTDSINGGLRNTFDFVPDAPFTRLVLKMQGGKKGLLENSTDICARKRRATVKYAGHNGARYVARPLLKPDCRKSTKGRN